MLRLIKFERVLYTTVEYTKVQCNAESSRFYLVNYLRALGSSFRSPMWHCPQERLYKAGVSLAAFIAY
jgi:hypothetical protein